jgi:hypothetical protein
MLTGWCTQDRWSPLGPQPTGEPLGQQQTGAVTNRRDGQRNRWPSAFFNGPEPATGSDHNSRGPRK